MLIVKLVKRPRKYSSRVPGLIVFLLLLSAVCAESLRAQDTTLVVWDRQRIDSLYRVDFTRLVVPDARKKYKRIIMTYTLECPRTGCDPWDRIAEVFILDSAKAAPYSTDDLNPLFFDVPRYELGRIVTPYGQGWSWEFDVTRMRPLLHDSVTFGTYITVFLGRNHHGDATGFLASMSLRFEEGEPDFIATDIDLLWRGSFLYGIPEDPIEEHLSPITMQQKSEFAVVRIVASGHGQGNTDNAAEFARKLHTLKTGEAVFAHYLWRDDCDKVAVGEQYGSWKHSRAGFCPGSEIYPWENDISSFINSDSPVWLDYDVEPYVNHCRPGVDPCPCEDCEYNDYGHTMPHINIDGQLIWYEIPPSTPAVRNAFSIKEGNNPEEVLLHPNLNIPTDLTVTVLNPMGTIVYRQRFRGITNRPIRVDLSTTPGRYQLKAETSNGTFREAIVVGG